MDRHIKLPNCLCPNWLEVDMLVCSYVVLCAWLYFIFSVYTRSFMIRNEKMGDSQYVQDTYLDSYQDTWNLSRFLHEHIWCVKMSLALIFLELKHKHSVWFSSELLNFKQNKNNESKPHIEQIMRNWSKAWCYISSFNTEKLYLKVDYI